MKTFAILILFAMCGNVIAQNKLMGFVTEQNSGKKPVENVTIKSFGANPIISSSKGDFILTFQGFEAGKNIVVRAEKEGWELVNEKEMHTFVPLNPNEKPLKIVLCKAGTLAKAKSKYYEAFEENLIAELNKLKAKNIGNEKEIAKLEEDFSRIQKQLNDLADEYSRINLDDASEKELKAVELFRVGKYDEFIALKNSIVTEEDADKALKNKHEAAKISANADSTIKLYFKSQREIAKTQILQFKVKEAEETFVRIILKDSTNIENITYFAFFLSQQNKDKEAILFFKKAILYSNSKSDIIYLKNSLGALYDRNNNPDLAIIQFNEASVLSKELIKVDSISYEMLLIPNKLQFGNFLMSRGKYHEALNSFYEGLEILEKHSHKKMAFEYYIIILNNITATYLKINELEKAKYFILKALDNIDKENNDYLSVVYQNLGAYYKLSNKQDSALFYMKKGLEIDTQMNKKNPSRYNLQFSSSLFNIGLYFKDINKIDSAINYLTMSLEIRETLLNQNFNKYSEHVINNYNNLGLLYEESFNYSKALEYYKKSVITMEKLVLLDSIKFLPQLGESCYNIGGLYISLEKFKDAYEFTKKSIEYREAILTKDSHEYKSNLGNSYYNIGIIDWKLQDSENAIKSFNKSYLYFKDLCEKVPERYCTDLAQNLNSFGILYKEVKKYNEALDKFHESIKVFKSIVSKSDLIEPEIGRVESNIGIMFVEQNLIDEATFQYQKSLNIFEKYSNLQPNKYELEFCRSIVLFATLQTIDYKSDRAKLVNAYFEKAKSILPKYTEVPMAKKLLSFIENLEEQFKKSEKSVKLQILNSALKQEKNNQKKIEIRNEIILEYTKLLNNGDSTIIVDLGETISSKAWLQIFEKQFVEAEKSAQEALNPTTFKKTEDYDAKIKWANTNLALALLFQGKYAEAEKIYVALKDIPYNKATYRETFLADLEELEKAGIKHPDVIRIKEMLKK